MIITNILQDNIAELELVDHMGTDMRTVNAARSSYGKQKDQALPDDKDSRLIKHLGDHHHTAPLRHVMFTLRVKAPEFVARQWYKHIVGCAYAFKDLPWSEFSMRFSEAPPEMYVPPTVRAPDPLNKQATVEREQTVLDDASRQLYHVALQDVHDTYKYLMQLDGGAWPREQARGLLSVSQYTEWVWTCSLQAAVHFCALRDEPHAQWEIQAFARALESLCKPLAPESWASLRANEPTALKAELAALRADNSTLRAELAALKK